MKQDDLKLGLVLFDYFPFGGLQRDCLKVAQRCVERGHSVTVFARTWQGDRPAGVEVQLLGRQGLTNAGRNRAFIQRLADEITSHGFDGIVGFNKVPRLDVYYGADPCYAAKIRRLKPAWYRWLPRCRYFGAIEKSVFQKGRETQILLLVPREIPFYQQFYGTESERFHLLPPGITRRDATEERRQEMRAKVRRENGWGSEDRLALFVGSGFRIKGLDRAIRAFASLEDATRAQARLVVVGQDQPAQFAALARRMGVADRTHFLGGRHDVANFFASADLLLHPAHSESAGMVLLEALASGLPVLTTDVCGYAFHVSKADGGIVLTSPFNQADCDRALREMLTSNPVPKWRANGLAYAAREDLYSCHERAVEIIEQTVRRKLAALAAVRF